jgi:hypothetical protein
MVAADKRGTWWKEGLTGRRVVYVIVKANGEYSTGQALQM